MIEPMEIRRRILAALDAAGDAAAEVVVEDTTGTGDHFRARVASTAFQGKSRVEQHQLVYAHLRDLLASGELHALALTTSVPAGGAGKNL